METNRIPFLDLVTPHAELKNELACGIRASFGNRWLYWRAHGGGVRTIFRQVLRDSALRWRRQRHGRLALCADGGRCHTWRRGGDRPQHLYRHDQKQSPRLGPRPTSWMLTSAPTTWTLNSSASIFRSQCRVDGTTGRVFNKRLGRPVTAVVPVHLYGQAGGYGSHPGPCRALRPASDRRRLPGPRRGVFFPAAESLV